MSFRKDPDWEEVDVKWEDMDKRSVYSRIKDLENQICLLEIERLEITEKIDVLYSEIANEMYKKRFPLGEDFIYEGERYKVDYYKCIYDGSFKWYYVVFRKYDLQKGRLEAHRTAFGGSLLDKFKKAKRRQCKEKG